VHQAVVDSAPRWEIDGADAHRSLRAMVKAHRRKGDPHPASLFVTLTALLRVAHQEGGGRLAQIGAERLGQWAGLCEDCARRCRDWLERHGIIAVLIPRVRRVVNGVTRLCNAAAVAIFPERGASSPSPASAGEEEARPALARGIVGRWLDRIGAVLRPSNWIDAQPAHAPP
jgi:hypothetical protein